jgi:hypothetical protein
MTKEANNRELEYSLYTFVSKTRRIHHDIGLNDNKRINKIQDSLSNQLFIRRQYMGK